jgi:hypothetical protein
VLAKTILLEGLEGTGNGFEICPFYGLNQPFRGGFRQVAQPLPAFLLSSTAIEATTSVSIRHLEVTARRFNLEGA